MRQRSRSPQRHQHDWTGCGSRGLAGAVLVLQLLTCGSFFSLSADVQTGSDLWIASVQQSINISYLEWEGFDTPLLLLLCVWKSECGSMCCLLTHVEVVCMFLSSCSVAWQLSLCFGVPLCWWEWLRTAHTAHISPFFHNCFSFVSLSCLSAVVYYLLSAHSLNPRLTCWCFLRWKVLSVSIVPRSIHILCICTCVRAYFVPNANKENGC